MVMKMKENIDEWIKWKKKKTFWNKQSRMQKKWKTICKQECMKKMIKENQRTEENEWQNRNEYKKK